MYRDSDNVSVPSRWPFATGVAQGRYHCIHVIEYVFDSHNDTTFVTQDSGAKYSLQQFAFTPTGKVPATPTQSVAPPTPSGWDDLQLYQQWQLASDMLSKNYMSLC